MVYFAQQTAEILVVDVGHVPKANALAAAIANDVPDIGKFLAKGSQLLGFMDDQFAIAVAIDRIFQDVDSCFVVNQQPWIGDPQRGHA